MNDPFDGGTHLPDITVIVPVIVEGETGGPCLQHVAPSGSWRQGAGKLPD